jgi:hypothetical protein
MTQLELNKILTSHALWLETDGREGNRADLTRADLTLAKLTRAKLAWANLTWTNLTRAILTRAKLTRADLTLAKLTRAILAWADLTWADLTCANLRYADLTGAKLTRAKLTRANFAGSNLREANLGEIKADFFKRLAIVPNEIPGLRKALVGGKVDGSAYQGECRCFVGTVAKTRGCEYDKIEGLKPDGYSPTERWFTGISVGDTPKTNQVSAITVEWIDEFLTLHQPNQ